ncbi:MAG: endonuclease MutS2 [Chloroflexi bacterium]|nr:endonuclease MutS2 [Chloroflexota bacterium]
MTNLPDVRPASATGPELRERTLDLLEFPRIREALASHTRTPMSRERALALTPVYDSAAVAALQQETAEAGLLLEDSPPLSLSHDPRPLVQRAAMGSALSGSELIAVADGLDTARSAKALGGSARSRTPLLRNLTRNIADLRLLERELRAKLTPSGERKDDASPLLRQLRAESRDAYHHASQGMQAYVDSYVGVEVLQDRLYTVRGGRLVLPVKADFKGRMPGIVHGTSDSGATLFIEPFANVHRTNRWREAGDAEQDEVRRILQRLTASVGRRAAEAMHALEMVARLDAALAKARYARTYRGVAVGEGAAVQLVEARHPLIDSGAVPVSLALEPPVSVLVVTGPNTGGKTVALKTLGLMALMRQSGLLLPCAPQTSLPLFDGVYADIGDQQSIELAVSTFSSHITAIAGILAHATPRSLALFDELGTSTDPEEGAALGCAVAAHLAEQGVPCVVTTHHRPLAALAEEHEAMENASVELDPQTLRPTYKFTMGLPGRSYAMEIAARTGLDARIIEAAQQRLGPAHRETEGLLSAIRWERALTREKLDEAEAERARASELSAELARQVEALEAAQASVVEEVRAELRQEASRVRAKLKRAESAAEWQTFRGEPPPPRVMEAASADVADVQRALRSRVWGKRPPVPPERKTRLNVGETVEVGALGIKGAVLTEPDSAGRVEVLVGSARIQLDVSRLRRAGEPIEDERTRRPTRSSVAIPLSTPAPGIELDVRGERANGAVERLDAYLDSAVAYGLTRVRIVHGKGTGALRNAVWRRLADSSVVASYAFAPRERGGDGATEVELL